MLDCNHPECVALYEARLWIVDQAQDPTTYLGSRLIIMCNKPDVTVQEALATVLNDVIISLIDMDAVQAFVDQIISLEKLRLHAKDN